MTAAINLRNFFTVQLHRTNSELPSTYHNYFDPKIRFLTTEEVTSPQAHLIRKASQIRKAKRIPGRARDVCKHLLFFLSLKLPRL